MVVVREAIVAAAMMLGIGEEVKENVSNYANPKTPEVELLIQCFNLVENELAVDYMPPIKEETCEIDDGKLYFEDLEYEILRVLWVKNIAGEEIPFQIYPEYLALKENTVKIRYSYVPSLKGLNEVTEIPLPASTHLFALGMAAEYALATGMFEAARIYGEKYRKAIERLFCSQKAKNMPSRRWV